MLDLSTEFHPVPKVYKSKKPPTPLKQVGKKGKASLDAVAEMKKEFLKIGITTCEAKLSGCWHNNALSFAHPDKRRYLKPEDLTVAILCCVPCHQIIEAWPREKMKKFVEDIILGRSR